ncbi:MAG TPA: DUF2127 domain-containing protein [Marmoricola sp.]|nr:DUF2127 domain-containing protein [Nocardioidaceae bacterium]MCB8993409.1 DUF2127 domain-containing protein [Nocardioidaceae bacterium]MCO5324391.1 DUF2127 domain-containing protein [Nocardioidaceae bacterium]HRV68564.1 DUF2127 domain-containing protein [Marmoricola sp.]
MRKLFAYFDWNILNCGWRGHVLYAPTETDLAKRISIETPNGVAWRCLRCEAYVVGKPHSVGPAQDAPLVVRGRALRDALILRAYAVERVVRGALMAFLAVGVYLFKDSRHALNDLFETYVPLLQPAASKMGVDLDTFGPVRLVDRILQINPDTLNWVIVMIVLYSFLLLVQGVGLWSMKRWGEYVAAIATSVFIPFEIHEIVEKVTWIRVSALILNLLLVFYIVWTKRLFGLRGGVQAFVDEMHRESVMEIEHAAIAGPKPAES